MAKPYIRDNKVKFRLRKKITGHSLVDICGLNKYKKPGDVILQLLGFYTPAFDPKYRFRGNNAEQLARIYYSKKLGFEIVFYTEEQLKACYYDVFNDDDYFGGVPDIEIPKDLFLVEVKSKSMKDYDEIVSKGNLPLDEVYQGMYYAYKRNYPKFRMFYVFYDEETEKILFEGGTPTTYKNVMIFEKEFDVDREDIEAKMKHAQQYYNWCYTNGYVPLEDISDKVLIEMGLKKDNNGK